MLISAMILLTSQEGMLLDKLIKRDAVFSNAVIERTVGGLNNATGAIAYVQVGGLAHAENRGSNTAWFAYNHQINLELYTDTSTSPWGEVESYESYTKLKPSEKIDTFALLIIGGMGLSAELRAPRRSPLRAQWEALSSVGLGVSLMQNTSISTKNNAVTVTGTVPGVGNIEYVFETGKSLKPKSLTKLTGSIINSVRYFTDHDVLHGVLLANMSVKGDFTTYLKSISIEVPKTKTFPMDWFDQRTLLMTFNWCSARTGHYSKIAEQIGHEPKSILELIANRYPHLKHPTRL